MRVLRDEPPVATISEHKDTTSYETTRPSYAALWGLLSGNLWSLGVSRKRLPTSVRKPHYRCAKTLMANKVYAEAYKRLYKKALGEGA